LIELLKKKFIQFGYHYLISIKKLNIVKKDFKKQKFINAERIAREGISLPIDPNLKKSEIKKIYKVVNSLS